MGTGNKKSIKKPIEQYEHNEAARMNNPPIGLVTPETDKETRKKTYVYDPHLDPSLQWAGKAERTSFEVPTVSLHVHERIDPRTILEAVRKRNGVNYEQTSFFNALKENPPLREAIEFYKHSHGWSNRLLAGDSLLVMNSLLEKEGLAGQVQMIYIDPPYGVKYGSNFQPFISKRDVKDGKDEDLTQEPEMIKAFRDTWELGIHSYLTYLRDRLLLARELLSESGSVFVQISDENVHHVREIMDDVFGAGNYFSLITFRKASGLSSKGLNRTSDYLIWYAKNSTQLKFNKLFLFKKPGGDGRYSCVELPNGIRRRLTREERDDISSLPQGSKIFVPENLYASAYGKNQDFPIILKQEKYYPKPGSCWKTTPDGMERLINLNRIDVIGYSKVPSYVLYYEDYPVTPLNDNWEDTQGAVDMHYVVQTSEKVIQRCLLMSTDPGDLVFDPTCGSGTTAYVAEQWGRRWITCDTSRVATALAKQRLMTAIFDYYELAHPDEGVSSGFKYKTVPHVTLGSIANNEPPEQETLYDQPFINSKKVRVSGPFTVEAVPSPIVKPIHEIKSIHTPDISIARSGETLRQAEWRDELFKSGIRGKGGQKIQFSRIESLPGTRWLHADGETREEKPQRVVVSFGPEHAPLEKRQVALAIEEAQKLVPKPKIIVFATFQFDPEAAKDIEETNWPGVTLLKVQMNTDLLTDDLKKKKSSNESFFLIGQPDVKLEKIKEGEHKGKYRVEVQGFDYYNPVNGLIESGGTEKIALWFLDTDYDGRSLFPRQVFFPIPPGKDLITQLTKDLKAEIDETLIESYMGNISLPFEGGENKRIAVKIIDARGIETLKIISL